MSDSNYFSAIHRKEQIEKLSKNSFDLLIFGGGITAAGIAIDGVSRGLSVALIEQQDFASGTSSKSTKLIHGGLRYLLQMQFKFVSKLGRERRIIYRNSQNNVIPTPILLPIYKKDKLKKIITHFGLKLYEIIAQTKKEYRSHWISKKNLLSKYNFLNSKGLKGAFLYYEFKTNDGRLVIETLKKSAELGAVCLNYASPYQLINDEEKLGGAKIKDHIGKQTFTIASKLIINATGAWCQKFTEQFNFKLPKNLYPTKGIHLVFEKKKIPIKQAFYIQASDKRMIFIIPRQDYVYAGTTDTPYFCDFRNLIVEKNESQYLINSINEKFPELKLTLEDVVSCWAGIRPLIKNKIIKPDQISRKDELFLDTCGLLTISGGKITGYRLMAKKVLDNAMFFLEKKQVKCCTEKLSLSGNLSEKALSLQQIVEQADYAFDQAKQADINVEDFKKLFYRYGANVDLITEKAYELRNVEQNPKKRWIKAELCYAVNHEMLTKLSDFFTHRTEIILFEQNKIEAYLPFVAETLKEMLSWTEEEKVEQIKQFEKDKKMFQLQ